MLFVMAKFSRVTTFNNRHVARLRKFKRNSFHEINFDDIKLNEDAAYIKKLMTIIACEERKLRTKVILLSRLCGGKMRRKKKQHEK